MNLETRKIILITVRADLGGGPYHIDLILRNLFENFIFFAAAPLNKPYGVQWQKLIGKNHFFELPFRSFNVIKFFKLINFIKINSIRTVHSHGKGAGIYGRLLKIFVPGIKVIHTFHGLHVQQYNVIKKNFYVLLERLLSTLTDQLINVSLGEQNICLNYRLFNKKKSQIIYNAIPPILVPTLSKDEIKRKLSLSLDKFIIISVLRFNVQKNLPLMLNIAEQLIQNDKILFLIIGDGEQRKEVEDVIGTNNINNIELLGFKNNINEYLFASDVYLSTSLWEGLPYSLIEAASCGLPIVASDVTGNNEIVNDGENGYLFPLNKAETAVDKILMLKESPDLRNIMAEKSLKIVRSKFQLNKMIEQIKEIYSEN